MAEVVVAEAGPDRYSVTVRDGGRTTTHEVTVPETVVRDRLRLEGVDGATLVRESFVFLLQREPPSSIMGKFSLDVIARYVPEYYDEMRRRLGGS
jgi:hypothetical protein